MAITGLDAGLAGMQWPRQFSKGVSSTLAAGRLTSFWSIGGRPGAGSFDTTLAGVALSGSSTQVAGQINFVDPGSGNTNLARFRGSASQAGTLLLCDRLWHNGGYTITSTSAQSTTFPGLPSRDANGSTNGAGVYLGCEISAATGAGTPTITCSYTNQAGTSSRSATNIIATSASSAIGTFYEIGLQAGDYGVRSLQSVTLSATWTSGTMNMVAYRIIAELELPGAFVPNAIDIATSGMPRMFNGTVPFFLFLPNTTTASTIQGTVVWTQG